MGVVIRPFATYRQDDGTSTLLVMIDGEIRAQVITPARRQAWRRWLWRMTCATAFPPEVAR